MLIVKRESEVIQYDDMFKDEFDSLGVIYQHIKDFSALERKLTLAQKFTPIFDGEELVDIEIIKTNKQFEKENQHKKEKTFEERLIALEKEVFK